MSEAAKAIVLRHWELANARRWQEFEALLDPQLRYEVPQTREYIDTGAGYLDMFRTWPGLWTAEITQLICEPTKAVSVIEFKVGSESMTGISIFGFNGHRICAVTDYWPEPYDPPVRLTPHLKRHPLGR